MIGKTLSHYKVIEKIGQGGMGEVYRAEDTSLKREVAIKVLPEQFTKDPQRLARFEREAQLLASLNHPNIAAIHSFEHANDIHFLVLELVPGETLAERVAKGPLPVEEALEVCRQIADGVEAAHEKGVIHRDLKPANVKVTPEGKVKILDFGLAKAFEDETPVTDMSQSPTLTEEMTRAGVILGTAAYMSPEQAKGKPVDKRADIFAFGSVLYELLTARRAFEGESITETIAAVLKSEPDWEVLPETTPWRIKELLGDCLQKEPHNRLHDIANVRIQIKKALEEPTTVPATTEPPGSRRTIQWSVGALIVGAAVTGFVVWSVMRPSQTTPPQPLTQFSIATPTAPLTDLRGLDLAISPNGRRIAYVGTEGDDLRQLYLRPLDGLIATAIPGTEGAEGGLFFSPDGESIAFVADGRLKKVSLSGGLPITLCEVTPYLGGSWFEDTIVLAMYEPDPGGLYRVSASGGEPESLLQVSKETETWYRNPEILPGGKAVLFSIWLHEAPSFQIAVLSLETGEKKVLVAGGTHAYYAPTGHLIYEAARTGTLMATPFDLGTLEVTGNPVPVLEEVRQEYSNAVDYSFSRNGTLVYIPGGDVEKLDLVWVDRNGGTQPMVDIQRQFLDPRFSPDGKSLAVTIIDGDSASIWIYEIERGILSPLTDGGWNYRAVWTPDAERLIFSSRQDEMKLFWMPVDGSAEAEPLTTEGPRFPISVSLDGIVAYVTPRGDIGVLPLEGERVPEPVLTNRYRETSPQFSPDGRWLAFSSDRSGQFEVYVKPYPGQGGIVPISTDGGLEPVWARSGEELFYRNGRKMMVVPVQMEPAFKAEKPELLFEGSYLFSLTNLSTNYDVTPDGQRFVMVQGAEVEQTQINVVLNWFEELKRLVPTN